MKTRFNLLHPVALLAAMLLLGAGRGQAAAIAVPNFSFQDNVLVNDPSSTTLVSSWVGSGSFTATDNPPAGGFTGAGGSSTPVGGHLGQSAYLDSNSALVSLNPLTTIQLGEEFTLTVALGDRIGNEPGDVRIGFLINDAFVAGGTTTFSAVTYSPEGTFTDASWTYVTQAGDVGGSLKIYLGTGPTSFVNFDNVRLTSVPEPAAAAIAAPFALLALARHRRGLARATD
jgi:hypothetical protein